MKIFGHRGAAGLVAENTLESIQQALHYKVDGIEIDVHCCKSGELVVIHDNTVDRTTNGSGAVLDFTLKELRQLKTAEGYTIPTLMDVITIIDNQCILNIELKGEGTAIAVSSLLKSIEKLYSENIIISSFDPDQLRVFRKENPDCALGVLTEANTMTVLPIAEELQAFSIHPPIEYLKKEAVERAHQKGFQVYAWTVNSKKYIKKAYAMGVDAIISDFPNFAV